MAIIYLRSTTGSDANSGATWALAKATLTAALTAAGTNGTVYVSQAHSEVLAANTSYSIPDGCRVLGVNDSAEPPTTLVSAADATHPVISGDNGATTYLITLNSGNGSLVSGIEFTSGANYTGSTSTILFDSVNTVGAHLWNKCKFTYGGASGAGGFQAGYGGGRARHHYFSNCILSFASSSMRIRQQGGNIYFNNLVLAGTAPSILLDLSFANSDARLYIENSDLSSISTLANVASTENYAAALFSRCPVKSGVVLTSGARTRPNATPVQMHLCDSTNTNYRIWEDYGTGSIINETTIIKTGGASDGTTTYSLKCSTTSVAFYPITLLEVPVMPVWIDTIGSPVTITVDFVHDTAVAAGQGAGTSFAFRNDEIWMEGAYMGSSLYPIGTYTSNAVADVLTTPSDQPSSSATWTTTGMTTPVKQKLTLTFTPQMKGYFVPKVKIAKASKVIYIDPKAVVS